MMRIVVRVTTVAFYSFFLFEWWYWNSNWV